MRKQARLAVGDFPETRVELALALQDVKKGRVSPNFTAAAEGIQWRNAEAKKRNGKKRAKTMA